jgi:hypothetical protein
LPGRAAPIAVCAANHAARDFSCEHRERGNPMREISDVCPFLLDAIELEHVAIGFAASTHGCVRKYSQTYCRLRLR